MGPKSVGLVEAALKKLTFNVVSYLQWISNPPKDSFDAMALEDVEKPAMPDEFMLLRRLRLQSGSKEGIPFVETGGFFDQPYLLWRALEACAYGEKRSRQLTEQRAEDEARQQLERKANKPDELERPVRSQSRRR